MAYTYVTLCRDCQPETGRIIGPYLDDGALFSFETAKEAFDAAWVAAQEEVEYLNEDCNGDVSFGIPEDTDFENGLSIKVNYYYGSNTELVTLRQIFEIRN